MSLPCKRTYSVGTDRFGRQIWLVVEGGSYKLVRHAANQRDETAEIELSREQLLAIGEIATQ